MRILIVLFLVLVCSACDTTPYVRSSNSSPGYQETQYAPGKWRISYQPTRRFLSFAHAQEVHTRSVELAAKRAAEICKGSYKEVEPDKSFVDNVQVTSMGSVAPKYKRPAGTEIWIVCGL